MATYTEIFDLRRDTDLRNKIAVAVAIKAQSLLDGATPTAAQVAWAKEAIANPIDKADSLMVYVLAKNAGLTTTQITGATDAAIQTAVNGAIDKIISGGA